MTMIIVLEIEIIAVIIISVILLSMIIIIVESAFRQKRLGWSQSDSCFLFLLVTKYFH